MAEKKNHQSRWHKSNYPADRTAALAADEVSRQAFREWQAERGPDRDRLKAAYEAANAEAARLWEIVGPDPIMVGVKAAMDKAAARDSDPNPDDPDDESAAE
jgi:hypothetical protein